MQSDIKHAQLLTTVQVMLIVWMLVPRDRCVSVEHTIDSVTEHGLKDAMKHLCPLAFQYEKKSSVSPDKVYSMIPDKMFAANKNNNSASSARLYENSAWCAPASSDVDYIQIDLGIASNVSMIATQGHGGEPILKYIKEFQIQYSMDKASWMNITEDGSGVGAPQVFSANDGPTNHDVVYNTFNNATRGRYFRIIVTDYKLSKCLRFELFGEREFDECSVGVWNICHKQFANCKNLFAAYKCHCKTGYEDFQGTGAWCFEINECLMSSHNCSKFATCTNKPGSFECNCKNGYRGDGYYCEDIDECKSSPCIPEAFCINKHPLHDCVCKAGYQGDGSTCTDVDECSTGGNDCHRSLATCTNVVGSFICTCRTGYTGNGRQCVDIDECQLGTHNCHQFAQCTNTIGGFSCDCKSGFKGDGFYCHDIDECALGIEKHKCKNTEKCFNLVGSHKCQCPKEIPMQPQYVDTETLLFGKLVDELSHISEKESDNPLDDYAQKIRKIYQLGKQVYQYHFKETINSFYTVYVSGNKLAFEMYDFRCTDVKKLFFPNHCHANYTNEKFWSTITDQINIQFVGENIVPFEQWATPHPSTAPTTTALTTTFVNPNSTNTTTTQSAFLNASTTAKAKNWKGLTCSMKSFKGNRGHFTSPLFPNNYPANTECKYLIEVAELRNVYINFTSFELERDRKCAYDNVKIYDGKTTEDRLVAHYCGYDGLPMPIRSSGRNMLLVFRSDSKLVMKGFNATWAALEPRVSVSCLAFNPLSYTSDSRLHTKYLARIFEIDRSTFIPISRMLACQQYPQCNVSMPRPIEFTFEHTITDRTEKMCIHWNIEAYGTTWSKAGCTIGLTNRTHTICKCWPYGIVAVVGRERPYYPPETPKIAFKLGTNCLLSLILVVFTLIGTLIYLTFKDNWIPYFMTILKDKDYDSGRIIQMHIVFNVLLTEMFFSSITFNMTASVGSCFFMAFIFYYLLQTVFFWLFIYTLFLQSRISSIFDSSKYNTYKIYLAMGYGIPFVVTLTVTGLNFEMKTNERMCWILFKGTTVWGYSGSVVTLALGSIMLLLVTIYHAHRLEDGILLQEKCLKNMFTTVFCLFAAVFGAIAVETGRYGAQYLFSLFNLLQCYSIMLIYCILTREQPMVQTNKVAPVEESGLGILAEIAMTKFKEEAKKTDVENTFNTDLSPVPRKKNGFKNLHEDSADDDFGSRAESGIASQGEESESDDDRDDGKIHFRYDEYQQLKEIEMMQQQNEQNHDN